MLVRFLARQPGKLGERISPNGSNFLSTNDKAVATWFCKFCNHLGWVSKIIFVTALV